MSSKDFRTCMVLPRDVVAGIDQLVGPRRRGQFVAEAVAEKLRREKLRAALRDAAGAL